MGGDINTTSGVRDPSGLARMLPGLDLAQNCGFLAVLPEVGDFVAKPSCLHGQLHHLWLQEFDAAAWHRACGVRPLSLVDLRRTSSYQSFIILPFFVNPRCQCSGILAITR